MNRGSALKWIERLRECEHRFQSDQLGWIDGDGGICMSPLGVLCEFIDPDGMTTDGLGFITWGGQSFYLPDYIQKKVKAKGRDLEIDGVEIYDQVLRLLGHNSGPGMSDQDKFACAAAYIEQVYEAL